jgi:hypothetical protein
MRGDSGTLSLYKHQRSHHPGGQGKLERVGVLVEGLRGEFVWSVELRSEADEVHVRRLPSPQ